MPSNSTGESDMMAVAAPPQPLIELQMCQPGHSKVQRAQF